MKKFAAKVVAYLYNAEVLADHTAIKGRKSGGVRDSNNVDWKDTSAPVHTNRY
jgi:hypothetical protein